MKKYINVKSNKYKFKAYYFTFPSNEFYYSKEKIIEAFCVKAALRIFCKQEHCRADELLMWDPTHKHYITYAIKFSNFFDENLTAKPDDKIYVTLQISL